MSSKVGDDNLTLKQKKFVDHFMMTGEGLESALQAGYSPKSASAAAYNNLHNDDVLAAIEDRRRYAEKKLGISPLYIAKIFKKWADEDNFMYSMRGAVELAKMFGYYASVKVDINKKDSHIEFCEFMEKQKAIEGEAKEINNE